jgi:hypothetical protein
MQSSDITKENQCNALIYNIFMACTSGPDFPLFGRARRASPGTTSTAPRNFASSVALAASTEEQQMTKKKTIVSSVTAPIGEAVTHAEVVVVRAARKAVSAAHRAVTRAKRKATAKRKTARTAARKVVKKARRAVKKATRRAKRR